MWEICCGEFVRKMEIFMALGEKVLGGGGVVE